jgi:transposase
MKRRNHGRVIFKPYHQHQLQLPQDIEEMIPPHHLVRVVNLAVDRMKLDRVVKGYRGGGTSSYHPLMLLKVLIYAYTQRIYSSRQIAKAIRENIHFMWLAGTNHPDFRTINRFRSSHLKQTIEQVFAAVVELLLSEGMIDLKDYFLDGTKIESAANRYSFVWGKSTRTFKSRLQGQVRELLRQIEACNEAENQRYGDRDLAELGEDGPIDSARLERALTELNERLSQTPDDRELKQAVKEIEKDFLPRQRKYEDQERKLAGRNSYSKTDEDATFMRMKEDHMRNGQLKPGYNVQMGTQHQFIVGYSLHQKPTDTTVLIPHLKKLYQQLGRLPDNVIADAGYGSEENYRYLDDRGIGAYVKYNNFHLEKKRRFKQDLFRVENLEYDEKEDIFICPAGRRLRYVGEEAYVTENAYAAQKRLYACEDCLGCRHRVTCHKGKGNRRIGVNPRLQQYRRRARELLDSETGIGYRSRRPVEVESVFGQIKNNRGFRRFLLRGLDGVSVEFGLLALAHNLMKWQTVKQAQTRAASSNFLNGCFLVNNHRMDLN